MRGARPRARGAAAGPPRPRVRAAAGAGGAPRGGAAIRVKSVFIPLCLLILFSHRHLACHDDRIGVSGDCRVTCRETRGDDRPHITDISSSKQQDRIDHRSIVPDILYPAGTVFLTLSADTLSLPRARNRTARAPSGLVLCTSTRPAPRCCAAHTAPRRVSRLCASGTVPNSACSSRCRPPLAANARPPAVSTHLPSGPLSARALRFDSRLHVPNSCPSSTRYTRHHLATFAYRSCRAPLVDDPPVSRRQRPSGSRSKCRQPRRSPIQSKGAQSSRCLHFWQTVNLKMCLPPFGHSVTLVFCASSTPSALLHLEHLPNFQVCIPPRGQEPLSLSMALPGSSL